MTTQTERLTVEAFWAQYEDTDHELVRGEVVEVSPANDRSSEVAALMIAALVAFVYPNKLGRVTSSDGGYQLDAHTLRSPDAAFYSQERDAQPRDRNTFVPFAPDLAVEVMSPSNSAPDMRDKVQQYLDAGTRLVWVVYPSPTMQYVDVFYPDGTAKRVTDTPDGEDVLPGFTLPLTCFLLPD